MKTRLHDPTATKFGAVNSAVIRFSGIITGTPAASANNSGLDPGGQQQS